MNTKQIISNILYKIYNIIYNPKIPELPKNKKIGIVFASATKKNIPLGEIIIREPFFRLLAKKNKLYLISSDNFAKEIIKINPFSKYFRNNLKFEELNKIKLDIILNLQTYNFSEKYLRLLKTKSKKIYSISHKKLLLNFKIWKYYDYFPKYYIGPRHELQRNYDIFNIKCNLNNKKYIPKINYKSNFNKKYDLSIVMFSEKFTKHWKYKYISKFIKKHNMKQIALIGDKNAIPISNKIKNFKNVTNYVGKTNLNKLIKIIHSSNKIITPDTGIAHLSAALNKKTIVLYGPTELERWKPLGPNITQIVNNESTCLNCKNTNYCFKKNNKCMNIDLTNKKYKLNF